MKEFLFQTTFDSPIGKLTAIASKRGLCALEFANKKDRLKKNVERICEKYPNAELKEEMNPVLAQTKKWLQAYFAGKFDQSPTLKFDLVGTDFEEKVWNALLDIDAGEVTTYGTLSSKLGYKGSARAVGGAVGRNPIGIILPCHRVISSTGTMTGYAGGLDKKHWLLTYEGFRVSGKSGTSSVKAMRADF